MAARVDAADTPPTVAVAAASAPNPVDGTTASLNVLGADDLGEPALKYAWGTSGTPPAAVTFSATATNAAKNATATFSKAGAYTLVCTITDAANQSVTSSTTLTVVQTPKSIVVAPASATLVSNGTQQYTVTVNDQFGAAISPAPTITWSVSNTGSGTVSTSGLFTANTTPGGPYRVIAAVGAVSGAGTVRVANAAPTVATAAATATLPVPGKTALFSALGADDAGETALTYTWSVQGVIPAPVTWSANGTNAAKSSTATFAKAGSYKIVCTIKDARGLSVDSPVTVTVAATPTTLTVTPAGLSTINRSATLPYSASAVDQFGAACPATVAWTTSATTNGTIAATGIFTANTTVGGPITITATAGAATKTAQVTVANPAPTIAAAAAAMSNPVTGTSVVLTALGADEKGEAGLIYTWATSGTPPAAVTFSANGTNAAKSVIATFSKAGSYTAKVTITDDLGATATSSVTFSVVATGTTIVVTPATASLGLTGTQAFTGVVKDQFGGSLSPQPTITWGVNTATSGSISAAGLFTANTTPGGSYTVTANAGAAAGSATLSVANRTPTIATAAAAAVSPVVTTSVGLSALGADDAGEAGLTYTWSTVGTPPASVTFSANGTNAAKAITATFTQAGSYTFQCLIRDGAGLAVASTVTVPVTAKPTTVVVSPASATIAQTATAPFSALVTDQFGAPVTATTTWSLSATTSGTIATTGVFTANKTPGGPITVTATASGVAGTAQVTVANATPSIATAAAADASPVVGKTAKLTVLGADDASETALIYTWSTTGTPPAAVTFSANGTNAAKAVTATFTAPGSYDFQVQAKDTQGATVNGTLSLTVQATATSITVAPTPVTIAVSTTKQFTASVLDQFAVPLTVQPTITWGVNATTSGTISTGGLFTANTTSGGLYAVTAKVGTVVGAAKLTVGAATNAFPTVATAAAATPSPVTGTTLTLSATGADDAGEPALTYTWSTIGTPPAAPTYSDNTTNTAKSAVATLTKAGAYTFLCTIRDAAGLTVTSQVAVTVSATPTTVAVSPATANVAQQATAAFTAVTKDQFGTVITPTVAWSLSATTNGTIASTGVFTANKTPRGPVTVTATAGSATGTAQVTVVNATPTVATAVTATPSSVTGTTAQLSVLGADDAGETALTYTWATTGTPPAAVTFSASGTNAAKTTTATFTKAGSYTFAATIADTQGLTVVSSKAITVAATLTSIVVTPATIDLPLLGTQTFTASGKDQFGTTLGAQPTFTWGVNATTSGSLSATGLFTANTVPGGTYAVSATSGTVSGNSALTVSNRAPTIAVAAGAAINPVTGTSVGLTVTGADDGGAANLSYTWSRVGTLPAGVSFSANGTNAAKATTVLFTAVGVYPLQCVIADGAGLTIASPVTVTVNATPTTVAVSPATVSISQQATTPFSAVVKDQFGAVLSATPTWTLSATTNGTIATTGLFTANKTPGGPVTVTAKAGTATGTAQVTVVNADPTIATAAAASASTVVGKTVTVSALGADDAGETALTYTWSTTGTPPAAVTFSANATNAAKSVTATFTAPGSYAFQVVIADTAGRTVVSPVAVTVQATATSLTISPTTASLALQGTQLFTAVCKDQFNVAFPVTWRTSATTSGTVSATGLFTANTVAGGTYQVQAVAGDLVASATLLVVNQAPTVATAAKTTLVGTGTTATLTALGADDGGESALTYTWSVVGTPAGSVTFSPNGTNTAKSSTVTFTKSGTYTFQCIIKDAGTLQVASTASAVTTNAFAPGTLPVATLGSSYMSVTESAGSFLVPVTLSTAYTATVTVPIVVGGDATVSATTGDVSPIPASLTFLAGQTTANIPVSVRDNTTPESDKTLVLELGTPTNATLGTPRTTSIRITDDDIVAINPIQAPADEWNTNEATPLSFTFTAPDVTTAIWTWAVVADDGHDTALPGTSYQWATSTRSGNVVSTTLKLLVDQKAMVIASLTANGKTVTARRAISFAGLIIQSLTATEPLKTKLQALHLSARARVAGGGDAGVAYQWLYGSSVSMPAASFSAPTVRDTTFTPTGNATWTIQINVSKGGVTVSKQLLFVIPGIGFAQMPSAIFTLSGDGSTTTVALNALSDSPTPADVTYAWSAQKQSGTSWVAATTGISIAPGGTAGTATATITDKGCFRFTCVASLISVPTATVSGTTGAGPVAPGTVAITNAIGGVCLDPTLQMSAVFTPPSGTSLTYAWSKASGPGTITFTPASGPTQSSLGAVAVAGAYGVRCTASALGWPTNADVSVQADALKFSTAPRLSAGGTSYVGQHVPLMARVVVFGNDADVTYAWSVKTAPTGAVTAWSASGTIAAKDTVLDLDQPGAYTVGCTATYHSLWTISATTTFTIVPIQWVTVPAIDAATDQGSTMNVKAVAHCWTDDSTIVYSWSTIGSTPAATYAPNAVNAAATSLLTLPQPGGYSFTCQASIPGYNVSGNFYLNRPEFGWELDPSSSPNPVTTLSGILQARAVSFYGPPSAITYTWSGLFGPAPLVLGATNGTNAGQSTAVTFSQVGSYAVNCTATLGARTLSADITVVNAALRFTQEAQVIGAASNVLSGTNAATLTAIAKTAVGVDSDILYTWSVVRGPGTIAVTGNGANAAKSSPVTFSRDGTYVLCCTATCQGLTATSFVEITVNGQLLNLSLNWLPTSITNVTTALGCSVWATWGGTPIITWSVVDGAPVSFSPNGTTDATSVTATVQREGPVTIRCTAELNGYATSVDFTATVAVLAFPSGISLLGPTMGSDFTLQTYATANVPGGAYILTWTQVSGPGVSTLTQSGANATNVHVPSPGDYVYRVTAQAGTFAESRTILVSRPAISLLGVLNYSPQPLVQPTATLSALANGWNGESALRYTWSVQAGSAGTAVFSTNGTNAAKTATATFSTPGYYQLMCTVSDGAATFTSYLGMTVYGVKLKTWTGSFPNAATPLVASLSALADAWSGEPSVTYTWSLVSGPGSVSFSANGTNAAKVTQMTVSQSGYYQVQCIAKSGTTTDTCSVYLYNGAITFTRAAGRADGLYSPVMTPTAQFSALATSWQGEPGITYTWSQLGGPVPVTFSSNGSNTAKATTISFTQAGSYQFRCTASIGGASAVSDVYVENQMLAWQQYPLAATQVTGTGSSAGIALSALASCWQGESNVIYHWSVDGNDPLVTFSANDTNAAKNTIIYRGGSLDFPSVTCTATYQSLSLNGSLGNPGYGIVSGSASLVVYPGIPGSLGGQAWVYPSTLDPTTTYTWSRVTGPGTTTVTELDRGRLVQIATSAPGSYVMRCRMGLPSGAFIERDTEVVATASLQVTYLDFAREGLYRQGTGLAHITASSIWGASAITYTWSQYSGPGTTAFTPNGTTAAKDCQITPSQLGTVGIRVVVSDGVDTMTFDRTVMVGSDQPLEGAASFLARTPLKLFDATQWANDASYRASYTSVVSPARIWETALTGTALRLRDVTSARVGIPLNTPTQLIVAGAASMPINLASLDQQLTFRNGQLALTAVSDATGAATIQITASSAVETEILISSPVSPNILHVHVSAGGTP